MSEPSNRIAGLSADRRRLLERLLVQNGASGAGDGRARSAPGAIPPAVVPPAPLPDRKTLQGATLNDVKANYKRFYDAVNGQLDASVFGPFSFFLNYGYLPNRSPQHAKVQLPDHFMNKNSVRLVLELIG